MAKNAKTSAQVDKGYSFTSVENTMCLWKAHYRDGSEQYVYRFQVRDAVTGKLRTYTFNIGYTSFITLSEAINEANSYNHVRKSFKGNGDLLPLIKKLHEQNQRRRLQQLLQQMGPEPNEYTPVVDGLLGTNSGLEGSSTALAGQNQDEVAPVAQEAPAICSAAQAADRFLAHLEEIDFFKNNSRGLCVAQGLFRNHILPTIGPGKPFVDVTPRMLADVLKDMWRAHPSLATKLQSLIKRWIKWGLATELYKDVLCLNYLDVLTVDNRALKGEENHNPCLDPKEMPELCYDLWHFGTVGAKCFLFSILTCARSQAVRLLTWDQLDLQQGVWKIPLENDKSKEKGRLREILLSPEAIKFLELYREECCAQKEKRKSKSSSAELPEEADYVFVGSTSGKPINASIFIKLIARLNQLRRDEGRPELVDHTMLDESGQPRVITQHGTARASFKTWSKSEELGTHGLFMEEAVELCLLHARKDPLKGAYDRSRLTLARRKVMDAWGKHCCQYIRELGGSKINDLPIVGMPSEPSNKHENQSS